MPKISVIIPVYNTEKYLRECLDSVLAQTFTDFEVLLINDGSTDKSGEICDEYAQKDARVKVFHKENGGASSARNLGVEKAIGEWICFIDSDDAVLPKYIESFKIDKISSTVDLVIQGIVIYTNGKTVEKKFPNTVISGNDYEEIFVRNKIHDYGYPVAKLFRTKVIKKHNIVFPVSLSLSEDLHFVLQYISICRRIQFSNEEQYLYMKREGSLSTTKKLSKEYFTRYFDYKHLLKKEFEVVYESFLRENRYHLLAESLVSTLKIAIDSLYVSPQLRSTRIDYFNRLEWEDFRLLNTYSFGKYKLLSRFLLINVFRKKYWLLDGFLFVFYKIRSLF